MEITGTTYSVTIYEEFNKTNNRNIFEAVIDNMMMDDIKGMNDSFKKSISSLPLKEKRMAILSLLDKDLNLFKKIKSLVSTEKLSKIDHLKDVILMLREYVKVGEVEKKKFGEVMTDLNLVKHILSRIPENDFKDPTKTFVDLANGTGVFPLVVIYRLMLGLKEWEPDPEKRYKHIVENQIYVSEIQPKNMFLYLCLVDPNDEYLLNIYTGSSLEDGFKKHMKEVWKVDGFSYSIGNPPFNQMVDLKFLSLSYGISDATCIVHPSTWLLDEKGKQRAFTSTKDLIKDHLESIELFNGNGVFGISLFVPCVITYINKNRKSNRIRCIDKISNIELFYDNINEVNKFHSLEYVSIKKKLELNKDTINHHSNKNNKYWINVSRIRGHVNLKGNKMVQDDFYTLIPKERKVELVRGRERGNKTQFSFRTQLEAENFLKYIKTNFVRFCVAIFKNKSDLDCGELNLIPWLDFTQEWTDERLYQHFNLTEDEIKFIEKHIPKYY